jgi:hypothetical protein
MTQFKRGDLVRYRLNGLVYEVSDATDDGFVAIYRNQVKVIASKFDVVLLTAEEREKFMGEQPPASAP